MRIQICMCVYIYIYIGGPLIQLWNIVKLADERAFYNQPLRPKSQGLEFEVADTCCC